MLPSFFIVGPPRTGTSWLHKVLKKRVTLPTFCKETRFFDLNFQRGLWWYRAQFCTMKDAPIGEIAPTYFASPEARRHIKRLAPWARIVCIFRNPLERVISLYRLKRALGLVPWEFEDALAFDKELMESSLYATHLREWFHDFGPDRVRAMFYEDLRDRPQSFIDELADFLGMPRFALSPSELQIVHGSEALTYPRSYLRARTATRVADWMKVRGLGKFVSLFKSSSLSGLVLGGGPAFAKPSPGLSESISRIFQDEITGLEIMLGRDLSAWKVVEARTQDMLSAQVGYA